MNMFGLGVVINATDNMSKGFISAINTLNDFESQVDRIANSTQSGISRVETEMMKIQALTLTGMGLQEVGSQISGVGQAMLSPFVKFGQQITSTGSQFENYRLTLKALYGDVNEASSKINEAMDLAAKTPFQLEDVMDSVVGFKALGVEVLDTMEDVTGESRTLLEYIGDLASLRPDVGLEGMLYGIRNLLGGDGGRSLRSRLDMDFEQMLGFEWADTTEGMIEQIVMASQEIANGLMKEMEGSWGHMTSNLEDQWDKFKLSVADSGAFNGVKGTLEYFYNIVDSIDDEKMARLGKNISSAFNMLWKPIDFVARSLSNVFNWFINIVAESPVLTKVLTVFTAMSGTVLVLVGAMTMLGGSVLIAYAGFKGLQLLFVKLPIFIVTMLPKLATAMTMFGKFALVAGSLYLAWKSDFLGVRTVLQNFMNNVATAFSESSRISQLGVDDMLSALKQLDTTTFGGWLTYRLTQLKVFWIALCDAWNDYTLSDENFQKVQALGLLPLLETILDLKMKAEAFFEGFKEGFQKVSDVVVPIIETIGEWIGKLWNALFPVNDEIEEFNENGKALDLKPWQDLGETLAYVVTGIGGLLALSKVVSVVFTIGSAIGKVFSFIGSIPSILGKVAGLFNKFVIMPILTTIGTVVTSILGFFGLVVSLPAWAVGLITLAVIGIVALIVTKWDEIKEATRNMLNTIKEWFTEKWGAIKDWYNSTIVPWVDEVKSKWESFKEKFCKVVDKVKEWFADKFQAMKQWYNTNIQPWVDSIKSAWDSVKTKFSEIITNIKDWFIQKWEELKTWYLTNIDPWVNLLVKFWEASIGILIWCFYSLYQYFVEKWGEIKQWYNDTIVPWIDAIKIWWNELKESISNSLTAIKDWFIEKWNELSEWYNSTIVPWIDTIKAWWNDLKVQLINIVTDIKDWFVTKWGEIKQWYNDTIQPWVDSVKVWWGDLKTSIVETVTNIKDGFVEKWGAIKQWYTDNIDPWVQTIRGVWDSFSEGVSKVWDNIDTAWRNTIGSLYTWVAEKVNSMIQLANSVPFVDIDYIPTTLPGMPEPKVGLATGGFVKDEGVAMLHPNEVVVNDDLTRKLRTFLDNNDNENKNSSDVGVSPLTNTLARTTNRYSDTSVSNDYSVTFDKGAIQITVENGNDSDIEKIAQQIMLKIKRQQQLDNTRNYKPSF